MPLLEWSQERALYLWALIKENQLLIRRMVMEKLLYSEIGAFDFLRKKNNVGPLELEFKISSSINSTISFFTYTVPDFFAALYAFVAEGSDLLARKSKIDPLIILHPILIAVYQKVSKRLREFLVEGNEIKFRDTYQTAMSKMVSNTLEGLSDIQINNLQETQLSLFDNLIDREMENTHSYLTLISRAWRSIHSRSVFEFAAEVWVAHKVMISQGINNQEYRTMLLEINRVIRLAKRVFNSIISVKSIYKHQKKVKELLNIPTFIEEDGNLKSVYNFKELHLKNLKYAYDNKFSLLPPLSVLDLQGEMKILPGKKYALVGQNRAGKSTLNHILCKIYSPDEGEITLNGIPYNEISRSSIRKLISYVSQRPFIFPGTVRDNIRVGNPSATEEEIIEAASAAGVFAFAEDLTAQGKALYEGGDDSPPLDQSTNRMGASINSSSSKSASDLYHNECDTQVVSEDMDSSKLVQRVWSVLNLAAMDDDEESDDDSNMTPPPIVPQSLDYTNNPVLDQLVELAGKNVSGGFAQSIALARIFVRTGAKIVILDEAMSQMDAFKKREIIFPKLFNFADRHNITLIIVTHDLLSVQNWVDRIFVLDHGRIVHQGSHKELISERAPFYMRLLGLKID
eukprot:gene16165-19239_t